jgi:two-component system cell cycle response regulator
MNPETSALRVLIVDDDADSREMMENVVGVLGHHCVGAKDGVEALAMQAARTVDVILSDWSMPEMNGVELCRRVREQKAAEYTCFVFLTSFGDRAHLLEGLRAGADDYLTKPVDLEELEARLLSASRVITKQRGFAERISTLRDESRVAFAAARTDPLTQTSNRLRLREDLAALQSRVTRYGHRYCVSLTDVDLFKGYNDTHGHAAGDDALRSVAATIHATLREGDSLYRYGGEEFLAILPEQDLEQARHAMERVCKAVAELQLPHPTSPKGNLTVSIGIAELQDPRVSEGDWLHRADEALYQAKREGRNRVAVSQLSS